MSAPGRTFLAAGRRHAVAAEVSHLRREAERAYSETDLLVAALREHVVDLRLERDRLLAEIGELRARLERAQSNSIWTRQKPPH